MERLSAVLLVTGLIERRLPRGKVGPLWMRLAPGVGVTVSLGLTFFTTLVFQMLGVSLAVVAPSFPDAPPLLEAFWYFMFTLGFSGVGAITTPAVMVPLLRLLTWPMRRLPLPLAGALSIFPGALFALGLFAFLGRPDVVEVVEQGRELFRAHPEGLLLVLVVMTAGPSLVSAILPSKDEA